MPKFTATLTLPRYSSAPSSPNEADLYYNTTDDKVYVYVNSSWVEVGAGSGSAVYYQSSEPASSNNGDLWIDSDDNVADVTSLTDSTSTTSSVIGASATAVKSAYDLAAGKIASVSGTSPISVTSGTTPTVSISSASTSSSGAVQLSDSTSSTSTSLAATANSVKTAYDLANAAIPKSIVTTSGDLIYGNGSSSLTRLGIGTSGQVLSVSNGAPSWSTPSGGGGWQLITSTTVSGSATSTISFIDIPQTYTSLMFVVTYVGTTASNQMSTNRRIRVEMSNQVSNISWTGASSTYQYGFSMINNSVNPNNSVVTANYSDQIDYINWDYVAQYSGYVSVCELVLHNYSVSGRKGYYGRSFSTAQLFHSFLSGVISTSTAVKSVRFYDAEQSGFGVNSNIRMYGM